ncbi:uncharacterized protein LOC132352585 [Balaenoptera ricei]|uniref:uncharacterized protein LOC132352585 n=1 Tax=Balaenoptera ricei TaxID=2746895 RepID=UPI0028BF3CA4|nr:uncharacterized protein LOC132352585 [Balaenoptera ricei]
MATSACTWPRAVFTGGSPGSRRGGLVETAVSLWRDGLAETGELGGTASALPSGVVSGQRASSAAGGQGLGRSPSKCPYTGWPGLGSGGLRLQEKGFLGPCCPVTESPSPQGPASRLGPVPLPAPAPGPTLSQAPKVFASVRAAASRDGPCSSARSAVRSCSPCWFTERKVPSWNLFAALKLWKGRLLSSFLNSSGGWKPVFVETQLFLRLLTAFLCISRGGWERRFPSPQASPEAATSCPPPMLASWRNDPRDQAQACDSQQHTRGDRASRGEHLCRCAVFCHHMGPVPLHSSTACLWPREPGGSSKVASLFSHGTVSPCLFRDGALGNKIQNINSE